MPMLRDINKNSAWDTHIYKLTRDCLTGICHTKTLQLCRSKLVSNTELKKPKVEIIYLKFAKSNAITISVCMLGIISLNRLTD